MSAYVYTSCQQLQQWVKICKFQSSSQAWAEHHPELLPLPMALGTNSRGDPLPHPLHCRGARKSRRSLCHLAAAPALAAELWEVTQGWGTHLAGGTWAIWPWMWWRRRQYSSRQLAEVVAAENWRAGGSLFAGEWGCGFGVRMDGGDQELPRTCGSHWVPVPRTPTIAMTAPKSSSPSSSILVNATGSGFQRLLCGGEGRRDCQLLPCQCKRWKRHCWKHLLQDFWSCCWILSRWI